MRSSAGSLCAIQHLLDPFAAGVDPPGDMGIWQTFLFGLLDCLRCEGESVYAEGIDVQLKGYARAL